MSKRVTESTQQQNSNGDQQGGASSQSKKFTITPELCLAINNIDYVLRFIQPFVKELGLEQTLERLEVLNGEMVAQSCRRTLSTLVQNAVENVENKILEVLDIVGEKVNFASFLFRNTKSFTNSSFL